MHYKLFSIQLKGVSFKVPAGATSHVQPHKVSA